MASILPSLNREDRALVACYHSLYAPRTGGRRTVTIGRRELLAALGGVAAWPLAARPQQPEPMRRIGVVTNLAAEDPEGRARTEALLPGLSELGWHEGRTLQIDIRWGADDADTSRAQANELLALAPDVIFATTTSKVQVLRRVSRSVPIVFAGVPDPVGGGLVATLARPGGNITGFALPEYGISVKWLELLKEIAPRVARVGVLSGFGRNSWNRATGRSSSRRTIDAG